MFILGFGIGVVVTGIAFILWGHKNQRKINEARAKLLEIHQKVEGEVKEQIEKIGIFK